MTWDLEQLTRAVRAVAPEASLSAGDPGGRLLLLTCAGAGTNRLLVSTVVELILQSRLGPRKALLARFRGCPAERLRTVLAEGTDAHAFWATDDAGQALEFAGDWPRALQVLDSKFMKRAWREVPSTMPAADLERLRAEYPLELVSDDGRWRWFSHGPQPTQDGMLKYQGLAGFLRAGAPAELLHFVLLMSRSAEEAARARAWALEAVG
jgi:hypothetical protein